MSVPVPLEDLATTLRERGSAAYVLTVGDSVLRTSCALRCPEARTA